MSYRNAGQRKKAMDLRAQLDKKNNRTPSINLFKLGLDKDRLAFNEKRSAQQAAEFNRLLPNPETGKIDGSIEAGFTPPPPVKEVTPTADPSALATGAGGLIGAAIEGMPQSEMLQNTNNSAGTFDSFGALFAGNNNSASSASVDPQPSSLINPFAPQAIANAQGIFGSPVAGSYDRNLQS